jgi:hypothetical protein
MTTNHRIPREDLMTDRKRESPWCRGAGLAALVWALILPGVGTGASPKAKAGKRRVAGKCVSAKASIMRREKAGKAWEVVGKNEKIYSGDLLIGLPGAKVASKNGAVRLLFLADLDRNSPYPIREAAVILHFNSKVDLSFTLNRGRVDLVNHKKKGPATVRVRLRKAVWTLTLAKPGTSIALETYGRWPAGAHFTPKPGPQDVPISDLLFLVLKGEVTLKHGDYEVALTAPPGPALIEWDSVNGMDESPKELEKLPPWANEKKATTPGGKDKLETLKRFRKLVLSKGLDEAIATLLKSEKPYDRTLAVIAMGAFDDLKGLGKALAEAKHADVWDHGVLVLRHWIGRCPGQDQRLYQAIVKSGKVTPTYAVSIMQLLHSFGEDECARPELYQTLIDYLEHPRLAIRGLSYWHLSRLVPEGAKFSYNPLDPKTKRAAAVAKWRKLIPPGKMPPKSKPNPR